MNGHLSPSTGAQHDGFPLGRWLIETRRKARQGRLSPSTTQALTAIDAWWNPPWPHTWQRTYHQAKLHHRTGQDYSPTIQRWADRQHTCWTTLRPQQQHLLTAINIHLLPMQADVAAIEKV